MTNRILIITNDVAEARSLNDVLGSARAGPFEIEILTHLSAGLDRLNRGGIDAIIVDLSLPDSRGIDTFDQLFAAAPHTPIMTLSALEDESLAEEAIQHGAQGYLMKGNFMSHLVPQAMSNVIQRKAVEEALYKEKSRAEIALNSIGDAVICVDMSGNVDYLNTAAETLTGWPREEACGHPIAEVFKIINGLTRQTERNPVKLALKGNKPMGLNPNTVLIRRDGSEAAIEDSTAPIHDWGGKLTGAVTVFHDVTAARAMAAKMAHLAQHDFLTNLPNRVLLNDRIAQAITLAKRHNTRLSVLFLDLDNFKHINDSLGHPVGDKLLQSVTERLISCVRGSDTVSRLGGDEFVILLVEDKSDKNTYEKDTASIAIKILAALMAPHLISTRKLHVTASIGISIYPADGHDAEELIKNADTAMYHAKEIGRNNYQFFRDDMNVRAVERQLIEENLRVALDRREFVLHYQPKVNIDTGEITGSEALLRWMHPEWGMVHPIRFITIAEDSGLIVSIGQWALREACQQAKRWMCDGLPPLSIAVNISSMEFREKNFLKGVRDILSDTGLDGCWLQLEITESVLMRYAESSTQILQELKNMGVELAVDDFGTGYSSLSYLKQFPVDVLKIDQSFVCDIASSSDEGVIVSAVIGMGNNLKKRVIAEGIETEVQWEFLKKRHCEEGQGYLFSHPLPAEQFATLLATGFCAIPWTFQAAMAERPLLVQPEQ